MDMDVAATALPEVKIYTPKIFRDARGFFMESFRQEHFEYTFVQDNHSASSQGVLRGLHYQLHELQGKLVRVVSGSILDVAVDVRLTSPTFAQWVAVHLDAETHQQLWIPPGFAHGFLVLSPHAEVLYRTTAYWNPAHERSIRWNDPDIGIEWNVQGTPVLSPKDAAAPFLRDAELPE